MDHHLKKLLIITSLIIFIILPIVSIIFNNIPRTENYAFNLKSEDLNTQTFSKEDYKPIIEQDKLSYGNITVKDLNFDEAGITNDTENYAMLNDDFASGALVVNYESTQFIETKSVAQVDNLDASIVDSNIITVLLNDTISVEYNKSIAPLNGFLIYGSRLTPCTLTQLLILDTSVNEISSEYYSIDSNGYLIFDYDDYFTEDYKQFELYLIWEYDILIDEWDLAQNAQEIYLSTAEQTINPIFEYNFTVVRDKINITLSNGIIEATNLDLYLQLSPADKENLFDHSLKVGESFISNYLNSDNSLNITIVSDLNRVYLNYTANFTLKFIDPIEHSWAIDRLVSLRNIRERIYFPSLIEGPRHHILSDLYIYEQTITIDQVISNFSLFERDVPCFDINVSVIQQDLQDSLIITENLIKKKGLKVFLPFLIKGETDPFTIKYNANNELKIVIADNIFMPLSGITVEFYYYNKPYGTYISNEKVEPSAPIISDENGEVILRDVPNGNYTLKLYRDNQILMETTVNTFSSVNYIATDIVHFPLWILIFGLISGSIILVGYIVYRKYKKDN